jgi:hypothetical protein
MHMGVKQNTDSEMRFPVTVPPVQRNLSYGHFCADAFGSLLLYDSRNFLFYFKFTCEIRAPVHFSLLNRERLKRHGRSVKLSRFKRKDGPAGWCVGSNFFSFNPSWLRAPRPRGFISSARCLSALFEL